MSNLWFVLDDSNNPVPLAKGQYPPPGFRRHVGDTDVRGVRVSTVFLGLDHAYDAGPPILFETMVFGGAHDQEQERYHTWAEAEAGHARWVQRVTVTQACAFADVEVTA